MESEEIKHGGAEEAPPQPPTGPEGAPPEPPTGPEGAPPELTEEEMRQLEEQLRKVRIEDVILQGLVPVLNLAARRIAKDDERDLGQGKAGIDAAQAMLDYVPEEARAQIQQAISELQLLYAKYAGEGEGEPGGSDAPGGPASAASGAGDSGLWTPGSH
ncbi:MAG: hypothetical protein EXQ70_10195 [Solirubrobacterales bacterium]|nr:hypothetical protein [Solirubrobacterales bacterium]